MKNKQIFAKLYTTIHHHKNRGSQFLFLILLIIYLFGLFLSLKIVLSLFGFDADAAHSMMLWHGITNHGLGWIKDWLFTPDNWLFSLVPIHFIEFFLLGPRPNLVIYTGWVIFVSSTIVTALIAIELGLTVSAYIIPIALAFLGLYAHQSGFISYAISHNTTNLFGLLSLLAFIKWRKTETHYLLVIIFFLQISGGLSDPWMMPTYILPLELAIMAMFFSSKNARDRKIMFGFFFAEIFVITLIFSQFFGALNFIPKLHFTLGDWKVINSNAIFLIKDLGGLFNIIPGVKSNYFISSFVSLGAIIFLYALSLRIIILHRPDNSHLIVQYFILFSAAGVTLAFLISNLEAANYSARFLISIVYLIPIAIAISLEKNWPQLQAPLKFLAMAFFLLFIASGITSNISFLKRPGITVSSPAPLGLISFLRSHGLTYGYGPYWGSEANAVTALSKWQIIIRPATFDNRTGRIIFGNRPETSLRWYRTNQKTPTQKRFFVIVKDDGENCKNPQLCIDGLSLQYGKPTEILTYQNSFILAWNHPLIGWENNTYVDVGLSQKLHFNSRNNTFPDWEGWSAPEPWGTWTNGKTALLLLQLTHLPTSDVDLLIKSQAYTPKQHPTQDIRAYVNNHYIGALKYRNPSSISTRSLTIPKEIILNNKGRLAIKFEIGDPVSPMSLNLSSDNRPLGLGLISLELRQKTRNAPIAH